MGVNDVGNTYYESNVTTILDEIMVVYFDQLQILYDAGARNFLLLSVPRKLLCLLCSRSHLPEELPEMSLMRPWHYSNPRIAIHA